MQQPPPVQQRRKPMEFTAPPRTNSPSTAGQLNNSKDTG